MNIKCLFLIASIVCTGLLSCEPENISNVNENGAALEVGSVSVCDQTKSLVTDYIGSGESIGVFVYEDRSSSCVGNNMKFQADGSGSGQKWTSDSQLLLGSSDVSVYGYYPYNVDVMDITNIPLSMDEQIDYLYAQEEAGISQSNKRVSLTMYHALAVIRLRIKRVADSNCSKLNRMIIEGANFSNQGTLNGKTGKLTDTSSKGRFTLYPDLSLTSDNQAVDLLVIPNGQTGNLSTYSLLDYNPYESSLGAIRLEQGKIYQYDLTVTDESMVVDGLSVSTWVPVIGQDGNLVADKYHEAVTYVDANGNEVFAPSKDCIGVILTANGQRLMIEKYENANNTESTNVYKTAAQVKGSTYTDYFSWGGCGSTSGTFVSTNVGDGSSNTTGYLPKPDGNYTRSPYLNGSPSVWITTSGALSDFAGKSNSDIIKSITTNGTQTSSTNAPMAYLMNAFNDASCSVTVNQGYKDWYIPSCGQLGLIWLNKTVLDNALTAIGGTAFSAVSYWSSSEYSTSYGWGVDLDTGYVSDFSKSGIRRVRLVRDY